MDEVEEVVSLKKTNSASAHMGLSIMLKVDKDNYNLLSSNDFYGFQVQHNKDTLTHF